MVPAERRSTVDCAVADPKPLSIDVSSALSPRYGQGQRICIDALCRSPLSPRGYTTNVLQRKESNLSAAANQPLVLTSESENAGRRSIYSQAKSLCSGTKYFSVHLVVAAVADGDILSDHGSRKTKCVLDQLTRNVSKEQNQVLSFVNFVTSSTNYT